MFVYLDVCVCVVCYTCVRVCGPRTTGVTTCINGFMYVRMCICIYIYIYRAREGHNKYMNANINSYESVCIYIRRELGLPAVNE